MRSKSVQVLAGRAPGVACPSHTARTCLSLDTGCWLRIHAFLYYSCHTGINLQSFFFAFYIFPSPGNSFIKIPFIIHFNHATKIYPLLSFNFTITLPPYISSTHQNLVCNYFCCIFLFSPFPSLDTILETSLWYFTIHHFDSNVFILVSLFIALLEGLCLSLKAFDFRATFLEHLLTSFSSLPTTASLGRSDACPPPDLSSFVFNPFLFHQEFPPFFIPLPNLGFQR